LPLPINLFSHSHGEELRKLIQRMDSKTHHGNGSHNRNIIITIITKPKTLVTKVLSKRYTVSPQMTNQFSHNHGGEPRKLTQRMASKTHLGNGFLRKIRGILVTVELMRECTDLPQMITVYSHNHGEEQKKHTQPMVSRTQNSNGSINQLLHRKISTISGIKKSKNVCMDLSMPITACIQLHIQEKSTPSTEC